MIKGKIFKGLVVAGFLLLIAANIILVYVAKSQDKDYVTVGVPGAPGVDGKPGERGEIGGVGFPGTDGRDGARGEAGRDGRDGDNGQPGPSGPQGVEGLQGFPGLNGNDGSNGINGTNGLNGADGRTPQFRGNNDIDAIEWKYENEADDQWRVLVRYCDLTNTCIESPPGGA